MHKDNSEFRVLTSLDKAKKIAQTAALWEDLSGCHPDDLPVILKGFQIMHVNGTSAPDIGTLVFFKLKNLSMAQASLPDFDKSRMEPMVKGLLRFMLTLNGKFKLNTELMTLKYLRETHPLRCGRICYHVPYDRRYEVIDDKTVEEFDYLNGPLQLRSVGSDQIVTIDSQGKGYYIETEGQPDTRHFVSNAEALNQLNTKELNLVNHNLKQNPAQR